MQLALVINTGYILLYTFIYVEFVLNGANVIHV